MATVFRANKEPGLTTELIRFFACLIVAIAIAASTMHLMSKQAGLGATMATNRAQAFATWYCKHSAQENPAQSCTPHLENMRLLPSTHTKAMDWLFRFTLSPNRGITIHVNEAGRVRLSSPSTPW